MRARWALAVASATVYIVGVPLALWVGYRTDWFGDSPTEWLLNGTSLLAAFLVGWLLVLRNVGGVIGWLLLSQWAVLSTFGLTSAYAAYSYSPLTDADLPGARLAAVFLTHGWPLLFAPLVALALVVPDGRLPSRRWRPVVWLGVVSFSASLVGGFTGHEPLDRPVDDVPPLALLPEQIGPWLQGVGLLGMIATLLLAAASLVVRYRRSDGTARRQLKWIALAGCLIPVAIISSTFDPAPDSSGVATWLPFTLLTVALPASVALAVLRYRLYDVDRVVSTTVVYVTLTVLLAAAFVAVILVGGVLIGGGSPVTTAAATLAVALAFRPVRAAVQGRVERSFNPRRWTGEQRVDTFLADLRAGRREPETVGETLAAALGDDSLEVFYWLPTQDSHADVHGTLVADLPPEPLGRTPVRRGDLPLATVVHADRAAVRNELAHLLVRAGLAVEIARLRVEVRWQLAEVERSRARIVSAALDERRRLERDLHDGAQQQLVAIGLDLRHLQTGLDDGSPVRDQLDDSVRRLGDAIRELRELAHGVRPSTLDAGLGPALAELAGRTPVRTVLDVTDERFAAEVEAAAYFVVSEALANALKHATPASIEVLADRVEGHLVVTVVDDGPGGAAAVPGRGLAGMADRVEALGGSLYVDDGPRGGTRVRAELPCA
jgi:signal transduction histidine kinase